MARILVAVLSTVLLGGGVAFADIDYWRILSLTNTVRSIAVDPTNRNVVYAAFSNAGTYQGEHGTPYGAGVFRSTDGGHSWLPRNGGLTNLFVVAIAIDPTNPSHLFAATEGGGVFESTNAGLLWAPRNTGLGTLDVYALAIDPTTPTTIYAGLDGGGVYRSTDGGASWTHSGGTGNATVWQIAIDPQTPSTLYTAGSGGVRKSVNGGLTFTSTGPLNLPDGTSVGDVRSILIDASSPSTIFAGAHDGAGVFKSTNGGASWVHSSTGLLSRWGNWRFVHVLIQDRTNPSTLYAATTQGTYRSIDGGATWVVLNTGLSRDEAYALTADSTGGAFIASTYGEFHELATRPSAVDHFRCFKAKARGFVPRTVSVVDRFGSRTLTALKPYRFCTPVTLGDGPVANPAAHLVCYRLRGTPVPPTFVPFLSNRLDGFRAAEINREDTLCVPAEIAGIPMTQPRDSYHCLGGPHWSSWELDLTLTDAFGTQRVRKTRIDRLCVPAEVDGIVRFEPTVDLRCDKLLGTKTKPVPTEVTVTDTYGTLSLQLKSSDSHCVQALESRS